MLHAAQERAGMVAPHGSPTVLRRDALFRRSLAVADVLSAALVLAIGVALAGGTIRPWVALLLPAVVLVGKASGLYDRDEDRVRKSTLDDGPALFHAATLYTLIVWLAEAALANRSVAWPEVLSLWALLFTCMIVARATARRLVNRLSPAERCLVVGHEVAAERLRRKFEASHHTKAEVVGCIPLLAGEGNVHIPGGIRALAETIVTRDVHRVVIAPSGSDPHTLDTIRLVKPLGVKVSVLPRLFEVVGSSVAFDDVDGLVLLGVPRYGLTKSSAFLKRAVDVAGSTLGIVVLAPLLALIALAIKLDSRGPVLFRQRRIGRGGREFTMLKFRTMIEGADQLKGGLIERNECDGLFKLAHDPRITRTGRFLRTASLDELPQLWNVLRGEMSLVGPRPLVPDEDCRVEGWQRRRLMVTPGMTGVWQILGSSRVPLQEMVKIDHLYLANWSLWLDVKILLRTALHVGQRRGL